ncbi:MAG: HutD/Ves family protein [Pseudobdellovibrio sp.]
MNIEVIRNFKTVPWKNGLGFTHEILIDPQGADFSRDSFNFRISSAAVKGHNEFSTFNGYQRLLVLLNGSMKLQHGTHKILLNAFEPHFFSGSDQTSAEVLSPGEVLDFGIIYSPEKVKIECAILQSETTIELSPHLEYFLYSPEGELFISGAEYNSRQLVIIKCSEKESLHFSSHSPSLLIRLQKVLS